jgi:hypothetical protein
MYSTIPIHWNIKSAPASPGRSLAGPALYVFSLLGETDAEPEFRDVTRRMKRYLFAKRYIFRGQAAQQGFLLFSFRVVGKIYLVIFTKLQ